jgi:hypothetical protein
VLAISGRASDILQNFLRLPPNTRAYGVHTYSTVRSTRTPTWNADMRDLRASQPQASQRAQNIYRAFLISALPLAAQQENPLKGLAMPYQGVALLLLYWADAAGTAGLPCCTAAEVGHLGIAWDEYSYIDVNIHASNVLQHTTFIQTTHSACCFHCLVKCYCTLCNDVKLCNLIRLPRPRRDQNKKHMGICIVARPGIVRSGRQALYHMSSVQVQDLCLQLPPNPSDVMAGLCSLSLSSFFYGARCRTHARITE